MKKVLHFLKSFQKTAGCLVIGNEILSGDTIDTNSSFLANFLTENGIRLEEIRTIEDTVSSIEKHVLDLSHQYTWVFTSGGIGSTHDDVTYEAIASAFDVELEINELVEERIRSIIPENRICNATFRMATLPSTSKCHFHEDFFCPLAIVENVCMLPGVSSIFQQLLEYNREIFHEPEFIRIYREIGTNLPESYISDPLREIASKRKYEGIEIGSYPIGRRRKEGEVNVRLRVSSFQYMKDVMEECVNEILESIDSFEM